MRVGEHDERRQHDDRGQQPRHDQERDRIVGERLERVDLLGDAHRSDFRGHSPADATGEHEPREQRSELEDDHQPRWRAR